MQALQKVMDEMNTWATLFDGIEEIKFPLSVKNIEDLMGKIQSELSPENLTCDGERSAASVAQRVELLTNAEAELAIIFRGES